MQGILLHHVAQRIVQRVQNTGDGALKRKLCQLFDPGLQRERVLRAGNQIDQNLIG